MLPPEPILTWAKTQGFTSMLVIGTDKDGRFGMASTHGTLEEISRLLKELDAYLTKGNRP